LIAIEDYEHGFAPETIEVPGDTEETARPDNLRAVVPD